MIAGIDFSSRFIDVVLLDESTDAATWHRFELSGADAFDRARAVRAAMPGSSFWDNVLAVGIEQPQARGPRAANMGALYRVQGAVLACLPQPVLVQPWWPSAWRKAVGLPGNASKEAVATFAERTLYPMWPHPMVATLPVWPQDAWDAYLIALATRSVLQHEDAA